jgi:hypothetical protein
MRVRNKNAPALKAEYIGTEETSKVMMSSRVADTPGTVRSCCEMGRGQVVEKALLVMKKDSTSISP